MGTPIYRAIWWGSQHGHHVHKPSIFVCKCLTSIYRWGESAGAMSVGLHMLTNNGDPEGLFRAAIMQSGSPRPVGDSSHGQKYYDELVEGTNCSNATSTLSCLRTADSNTLYAAVNATPSFFSTQVSIWVIIGYGKSTQVGSRLSIWRGSLV